MSAVADFSAADTLIILTLAGVTRERCLQFTLESDLGAFTTD